MTLRKRKKSRLKVQNNSASIMNMCLYAETCSIAVPHTAVYFVINNMNILIFFKIFYSFIKVTIECRLRACLIRTKKQLLIIRIRKTCTAYRSVGKNNTIKKFTFRRLTCGTESDFGIF